MPDLSLDLLYIDDVRPPDKATIGRLAATFGVKNRRIEQDADLPMLNRTIPVYRHDGGLGLREPGVSVKQSLIECVRIHCIPLSWPCVTGHA